ncbi:MAG: peroxidase [Bacteroidetes bacterium]|nr:MAG: peroxidase [Bacteroidota bacterium]
MAWIDMIDEAEASGELKAIYDEIIGSRGKLSNIMRIHSLNPPTMRAHMELYLKIMFGRSGLRRADRELLATVVSAANGCAYCVHHHAEALHFYWKDRDRVQRVAADFRADPDLTPAQRAMLAYAEKLTRTPHAMTEADVAALREAGFSDRDILDINLIVSYFNFVNRIAAGLGVDFSPEEVSGYKY